MSTNYTNNTNKRRSSFTLIELLVVLALVAILSVVVVMTLNPAELIKQARDSNRLSDLSTINTALNLFSADVTSGFMGTSTVVYVSIPNSSSVCANLGLPTLPAGYTYNCVTTANLRNTDGTGWIPVNFQRISSNSPISQLPVDPQNTTSTRYYTYVTGGSWKVIATPESEKYIATAGTDGGSNIGQFEVGNNMSLAPFVDGLIGWWKFDENGTSTVFDSSGHGKNGIMMQHNTIGVDFHTQSGCKVGSGCFSSNGVDSHVLITTEASGASSNVTVGGWVKKSIGNVSTLFRVGGYFFLDFEAGPSAIRAGVDGQWSMSTPGYIDDGNWHFMSSTFDGSVMKSYLDGVFIGQNSYSYIVPELLNSAVISGDGPKLSFSSVNGLIDDVRIYKRTLSAAEILAVYNATK